MSTAGPGPGRSICNRSRRRRVLAAPVAARGMSIARGGGPIIGWSGRPLDPDAQ